MACRLSRDHTCIFWGKVSTFQTRCTSSQPQKFVFFLNLNLVLFFTIFFQILLRILICLFFCFYVFIYFYLLSVTFFQFLVNFFCQCFKSVIKISLAHVGFCKNERIYFHVHKTYEMFTYSTFLHKNSDFISIFCSRFEFAIKTSFPSMHFEEKNYT